MDYLSGKGRPDLLVGYRGVNFLLEVKGPKGALNEAQERYHAEWKGQIAVVRTPEEALEAVSRAMLRLTDLRGHES